MWLKPGTYLDHDGKVSPLIVRLLPTRRIVPTEGMELDPDDLHIARLIRDKDLVPGEPPAPVAASPEKAAAVAAAPPAKAG